MHQPEHIQGRSSLLLNLQVQLSQDCTSNAQDQGACGLIAKLAAGLLAFFVSLNHYNGEAFKKKLWVYCDFSGGADFDTFLEDEVGIPVKGEKVGL